MEHDGGGGGGWDFNAFKAMINADNPAMLGRYALEHYKLARELHDVAHDLDRSLGQLDEVFDSQHAAPALKARLLSSIRDMDNIGVRIERNSQLLDQAAGALHKAQDAVNSINEIDSDASPRAEAIRDELAFRYASITPQLDIFSDRGDSDPGGNINDPTREASAYVTGGPGAERTRGTGPGAPVGGPRGGTPPTGRFNPGPTLGGQTGPSGRLGRSAGNLKRGGPNRTGADTANAGRGGSAPRAVIPGVRSGTPIGGYRPAIGAPGTTSGATPPGGSGTGKPGTPGGPGRPGMAPPGGNGPSQPGKDRPGRRLTDYEKLEPNAFRDNRHRVKPVIGEQRRQPDTFKPTPRAIGGKQGTNEVPALPELPTRETPTRFEGHDVSVSFNRRTRGSE